MTSLKLVLDYPFATTNTLFDPNPLFRIGALIGAYMDAAAVLETAYGMVPFSTTLRIKFSFSL